MEGIRVSKLISLVVPFYNESHGIDIFFERVYSVISDVSDYQFEIIAVNDGSRDSTLDKLLAAKVKFGNIHVVEFSRNFGKEAALTAGIDRANGDAVIPIDSDLQHPPELIKQMLAEWVNGADVVLAKRNDIVTDGPVQKLAASIFYRLHNYISDIEIPPDVGDFRLMDKSVVATLRGMPENQRFMKGLFAWVGFRSVTISYNVAPRHKGQSSFNIWKLWNFALEGITSFSTIPLRIWTYVGAFASLIAITYAILIMIKTLVYGIQTPGYSSLMVVILFLGGVQLIGIGVMGEYVGRIYNEVKRRPVYIVREEYFIDR